MTSAKCDLRIEQQPEKREESREKRDGHRRSSDVLATSVCFFVSMRAQAFVVKEREAEDGEEWKREGWPDARSEGEFGSGR